MKTIHRTLLGLLVAAASAIPVAPGGNPGTVETFGSAPEAIQTTGSAPTVIQSIGNLEEGGQTIGSAPEPTETFGNAPGTIEGCPPGWVCVYPDAGWNNGHPSVKYYTYGAHNLVNQFGMHRVFNNQTGDALAVLCKGYNGVGPCLTPVLDENEYTVVNFTPINSIYLVLPH